MTSFRLRPTPTVEHPRLWGRVDCFKRTGSGGTPPFRSPTSGRTPLHQAVVLRARTPYTENVVVFGSGERTTRRRSTLG